MGSGWYNPLPLRMWGRFNLRAVLTVGRPCLIAKLDVRYADGSREEVVSDTTWQVATGAVVRNSLYLGETYDARREGELTWRPAVAVAGPAGALQPRLAPPVCAYETWRAKQVAEPTPGGTWWIWTNFAGVAQIDLGVGARGERIVFRYGELLNKDGTVNGMTGVCGQINAQGWAAREPRLWRSSGMSTSGAAANLSAIDRGSLGTASDMSRSKAWRHARDRRM